jgi:acyl carrier protein
MVVDVRKQTLAILDEVLSLNGRALHYVRATPLLGAVPELDSMAVVGVITALEEHFGFVIDDHEIDASIFATVASLVDFVAGKLKHPGNAGHA